MTEFPPSRRSGPERGALELEEAEHPRARDVGGGAPLGTPAPRPRVAIACEATGWRRAFPRPFSFLREVACQAVIGSGRASPTGVDEVSLLLTDDAHQRDLNSQWRGIDSPTNVLSFPDGSPLPDGGRLLGDVVLALDTCRREAREQGKSLADHTAHMVVHGVLHLLGFDHEEAEEAAVMESLEVRLLAAMGIADPYAEGLEAPRGEGQPESG